MKAFEEYGRNFIVSNGEIGTPFYHNNNGLFVHTIYALEFLGYIKVLSIKFNKSGHFIDSPIIYNINILPNDSFRALVYEDYRKENPKNIIEAYDDKKGVITFAGKNIAISKSGKETDATLLVGSLIPHIGLNPRTLVRTVKM